MVLKIILIWHKFDDLTHIVLNYWCVVILAYLVNWQFDLKNTLYTIFTNYTPSSRILEIFQVAQMSPNALI